MTSNFVFYQQRRRDGGLRTAIDLNDVECWQRFEPGQDEDDPALAWFVDIRGEGDAIPFDPDQLREWLLDRADLIRNELLALAKRFDAGADSDPWPWRQEFTTSPAGAQLEIVVSASRRSDALGLPHVFRRLGQNFLVLLRSLDPVVSVR